MSGVDVKNRRKYGDTMSDNRETTRPEEPQEDLSGESRVEPGTGDNDRGGEAEAADASVESGPGESEMPDSAGGGQSLAAELEAARAEAAEQKDRYLRAAAEAENIRRRAENDVANARKYAVEGFASELLAVRDSLEIARSLEISETDSGAVAKMKEGLDLTLKQLDSAFSKYNIEAVEPSPGDKLDPERHQAMTTQESDSVPPNHVVSVIQKGYTIHDRLLRAAMVVVARKPQGEAEAAS